MPDHNGAYYRFSASGSPEDDIFILIVTGWVHCQQQSPVARVAKHFDSVRRIF